jgi:hypothetical protein
MLAAQDDPPSLWVWDCLQGHRCLSDTAQTSYLGSPDDTVQAPALLLKKALELPANSVLFFIVPKNEMVEDAAVIQGQERASIWKIQARRVGLEVMGSDIRNCCQTAYMLSTSLKKAAEWITLVRRTARADIERLRDLAENLGFLSAISRGYTAGPRKRAAN